MRVDVGDGVGVDVTVLDRLEVTVAVVVAVRETVVEIVAERVTVEEPDGEVVIVAETAIKLRDPVGDALHEVVSVEPKLGLTENVAVTVGDTVAVIEGESVAVPDGELVSLLVAENEVDGEVPVSSEGGAFSCAVPPFPSSP